MVTNKLWLWVVAGSLVVFSALWGTLTRPKPGGSKSEARATKESKPPAGGIDQNQSSLLDGKEITEARMLLGYAKKETNAWAVRKLKSIPRSDKNYATAKQLVATIPRDRKAEAALEADLKASIRAERRREATGEWSKKRIELELAMHPERRDQMARDLVRMHDAIKEEYGPKAALKFLLGK